MAFACGTPARLPERVCKIRSFSMRVAQLHVKIRFSCAGAYVDHTKNKNLKKKSQKKTLATVRSGPPCSVAAACRIRAREPQSPPLMRGGARRRVPSPPPTTCHRLRCPPPVATPAEADPPATEPPATTS